MKVLNAGQIGGAYFTGQVAGATSRERGNAWPIDEPEALMSRVRRKRPAEIGLKRRT